YQAVLAGVFLVVRTPPRQLFLQIVHQLVSDGEVVEIEEKTEWCQHEAAKGVPGGLLSLRCERALDLSVFLVRQIGLQRERAIGAAPQVWRPAQAQDVAPVTPALRIRRV